MNQDYNPKIYVMQLKELIYTAIFVVLTIILIIVMISMFAPDDDNDASEINATPTVYLYDHK